MKITTKTNILPPLGKKNSFAYDPTLNGLGGWMTIVIIGNIATILAAVLYFIQSLAYFGITPDLDTWLYIVTAESALFDVILSCVILYYIFKRDIMFRKLIVIQVAVFFSFVIISSVAYNALMMDADVIGRNVISAVVWITYLYKSKRVRNTFIYPYEKSNNA